MTSSGSKRPRMISTAVVLAVSFLALAYVFVVEYIDFSSRRLHVFDQAMADVSSSHQARQLLGAPVRVGWPIRESGTLSNKSGQARLLIPVSGTLGKGQVILWGVSRSGTWTITDLELAPEGASTHVRLIGAPPSARY